MFHFAILSDRTGGHMTGVYPRVIDEIKRLAPDFVVTVGDHIEGYTDDAERANAEWDTLLAMLDSFDVPVYMTPGNHDIWSDESEEIYVRRTGQSPYYSFDYENSHFVILDNSRFDRAADFPGEQLSWLESDLEASREAEHVFVFLHKPLWTETLDAGEPDPLHAVLVEHGADAVFCGHYHQYSSANYEGIDYTIMGSSGGGISNADEPVARGVFFQFGWVSVDSLGAHLAVIDLGGVYPRDVVTRDGLRFIDRIETELITVRAMSVPDASTGVEGATIVSIENATEEGIDGFLTWEVPGDWSVSPSEIGLAIEAGGSHEASFQVTNTGDLFPVPRLSFGYPLAGDRDLEVDIPLRVVRRRACQRLPRTPTIDGVPSETCWSEVSATSALYQAYEGASLEGETSFLFARDDDHLYVAAVCEDPEMDEVVASTEDRDGAVYREDCVGFFFQPNLEETTVYQIYFSARGTVFDQRITFDEQMYAAADPSWDGDYTVATRRMDDRWSIEARIPFAVIGADSGDDAVWATNFRRKQARTGSAVDWQVPIDYDPRTFGELRFE
jgi:hypothetical protein